jgi:hypothetical protein
VKRLAAVYGGDAAQHRVFSEPKYRRHFTEIIYLLDLPTVDLTDFHGLLVPDRLHQGRLLAASPHIGGFVARGGTVIAFGEQPRPWLPGVRWEHRPTNFWWWLELNARSGLVLAKPEHGLFRRLTLADATWHQHGVFWPPEGADTLIATEDGAAVLYIDRVSTPGTMLVTSLDPIGHVGSYFMAAAERFLDGFLPWVVEELL